MSKRIDEILRISDKGFVDEYDDIKIILENFLNYKISTLHNALPKNCDMYDFTINVAKKLGNIDINNSSQIENLRLSELLCIMKYFEKNFKDPHEVLMSYMKNLRNNISSIKGLPWATLFMSISVKSLMYFFNEMTYERKFLELYKDIFYLSKDCAEFEISDYTTIKQLFDGITCTMYASWNPGYDKDAYIEKITQSCCIINLIFIDGIAEYCYRDFNFNEFLDKHSLEIDLQTSEDDYVIKF